MALALAVPMVLEAAAAAVLVAAALAAAALLVAAGAAASATVVAVVETWRSAAVELAATGWGSGEAE